MGRPVAGCEGNLQKEYKNIKLLAVASKSQFSADNLVSWEDEVVMKDACYYFQHMTLQTPYC